MIFELKTIHPPQDGLFDRPQGYKQRSQWEPFPEPYTFYNGTDVQASLTLQAVDKRGRKLK